MIKSYNFRFRQLFRLLVAFLAKERNRVRIFVIFRLWKKWNFTQIAYKNTKAHKFQSLYIQKKVLKLWKNYKANKTAKKKRQDIMKYRIEKKLKRKLFVFWKKIYLQKNNAKSFIIKRVKNSMKRAIKRLLNAKNAKSRKNYIIYKSEIFRANNLFRKESHLFLCWKKVYIKSINIKNFIKKRIKNSIKRAFNRFQELKQIKTRKEYYFYKADIFRRQMLFKKLLKILLNHVISQKISRRLQLFFNYWKRVYNMLKKDKEKYEIGCRKRHLQSFYFKMLKIATEVSKKEKKAEDHYLHCIFRAFSKAIIKGKQLRLKSFLISKNCYERNYKKLVNYI